MWKIVNSTPKYFLSCCSLEIVRNISDPRVRELADAIIEAQREEIAEMKRLIEDLEDDE